MTSEHIGGISRSSYIFDRGIHTPEKRLQINSIPTTIVDSHNEVLGLWLEKIDSPAVLIHIDHHDDMRSGPLTFTEAQKTTKIDPPTSFLKINTMKDYVKHTLSCDDFISAAVYEGVVGCVYWLNPRFTRFKPVKSYGKITDGIIKQELHTQTFIDQKILWRSRPEPKLLFQEEFKEELSGYAGPVILDIDLDALLCTTDNEASNKDRALEAIQSNLRTTEMFLKSIDQKPTIISIARSQTEVAYAPPAYVDEIQKLTLEMLEKTLK